MKICGITFASRINLTQIRFFYMRTLVVKSIMGGCQMELGVRLEETEIRPTVHSRPKRNDPHLAGIPFEQYNRALIRAVAGALVEDFVCLYDEMGVIFDIDEDCHAIYKNITIRLKTLTALLNPGGYLAHH